MGNVFHSKIVQDVGPRIVVVNRPEKGPHEHQSGSASIKISNSNRQRTTKYTLLSFIPLSFIGQFRRLANVFFLLQTIIMVVGYTTNLYRSPLNPVSMVLTLLAVLAVTMAIEARDDIHRNAEDRETNNRKVRTLQVNPKGSSPPMQEVTKRWTDVAVGDLVVVMDNQAIPADMMLLTSSRPEGTAYVETSNIDGETNLKLREPPPGLAAVIRGKDADLPADFESIDVSKIHGHATVNQPNNSISSFQGKLSLEVDDQGGRVVDFPVNSEQLLLRGSTIQNTVFVIGLVVYTGEETKVALNKQPTPSKVSTLENLINKALFVVIGGLLIMTTVCTILSQSFKTSNNLIENPASFWYVFPENQSDTFVFPSFVADWLAFFIIFNNAVPINLYVTMEFCHLAQGLFVSNDPALRYGKTSAKMRTSNLGHELGVVDYIFSDKTGTLTQNVMETKFLSAGGSIVKVGINEKEALNKANGYLNGVLTIMSVAHTTMIGQQPKEDGSLDYQAESPDEKALVEAASRMGYEYIKRTSKDVTILDPISKTEKIYQILGVNQFDSTRKRMSCVIRDPNGKYSLFLKGADNVVLERLSKSEENSSYVSGVKVHLNDFANQGLRTLAYAKRNLSEEEALSWVDVYSKAAVAVENRRDELYKAADLIEKDLHLLGASAIEDKLQDGVPETIADLAQAGIKIWVLTGDKLETAINIGYSCKLLTSDMDINILAVDDKGLDHGPGSQKLFDEILSKIAALEDGLRYRDESMSPISLNTLNPDHAVDVEIPNPQNQNLQGGEKKRALVITGEAIALLFSDEKAKIRLRNVARNCDAVLACRVSPLQKANIVKLIRFSEAKPICLAIGDGANDVGMIQASQIGVGINGMEGLQAANSADVAIGQFRFLKRLILVHGAWNQARMTKVINYVFLKNFTIASSIFGYTILSAFSGTPLYEEWLYTGFNVFTFFLIIGVGILDQHVRAPVAMNLPQLYRHEGAGVTPFTMVQTITRACIYTLIVLFWPFFAYYNLDQLQIGGLYAGGLLAFTGLIFAVQARAMFISNSFTMITVVLFFLGFGMFFLFVFVYSNMLGFLNGWAFYDNAFYSMSTPMFWIIVASVTCTTTYVDFVIKYVQRELAPSHEDLAVETSINWTKAQKDALAVAANGKDTTPDLVISASTLPFMRESRAESAQNINNQVSMIVSTKVDEGKKARRKSRKAEREKLGWVDLFYLQQLKTIRILVRPRMLWKIFLLYGLFFIVVGLLGLDASRKIKTTQYNYSTIKAKCPSGSTCFVNSCIFGTLCEISHVFENDFNGTLFVNYGLTNFYQNHFRYTTHKSDQQLLGFEETAENLEFYCSYAEGFTVPKNFPCGMQSLSLFNDSVKLNSLSSFTYKLSSSFIGWPSDDDKFLNPENYEELCNSTDVECLHEMTPDIVNVNEGVLNKQFQVWMRLAGLSSFVKPVGVIQRLINTPGNQTIFAKGSNVTFEIEHQFPTDSFKGAKFIQILEGSNWYASSDPSLAIAWVVMGGLLWGSAVFVIVKQYFSPRRKIVRIGFLRYAKGKHN